MNIIEFLKTNHNIEFNEQQQQAVLLTTGKTLLLAVPGSGKTTVLVARLGNLILEKKVDPKRILTLTYSKEATKDMKKRYQSIFGVDQTETSEFMTIHSFCYRVLKEYSKMYDRQMPKILVDDYAKISRTKLLRRIATEVNHEYLAEDDLQTLCSDVSYVKNMLMSKKEILKFESQVKNFSTICDQYELYKKQKGYMDFDDMLTQTYELFESIPALKERFSLKYDHICVDEAQDTSMIQHDILKQLIHEKTTLFMVGDEDQSIYGFRGACPEALTSFCERYKGGNIIKMEQNFRCPNDISLKANDFIKQNKQRYDKDMFTTNKATSSIKDIMLNDWGMQYKKAIEIIDNIPKEETVGVIYRNNNSIIPLVDEFSSEGREFYIREHTSNFSANMVVKDVFAFISLSYDPKNIEAFRVVYYKLFVSKKLLEIVEQKIDDEDNIFSILKNVKGVPHFMKAKFERLETELYKLKTLAPYQAIRFIEKTLDYGDYIANLPPIIAQNMNQKLNVLKLVARKTKDLEEFEQRLTDLSEIVGNRDKKNQSNRVFFTTAHSCKGLEFDHVILIDLIEGIFPTAQSIETLKDQDTKGLEEEIRLFYVAITRAKKQLFILNSGHLNEQYATPSRFIQKLLVKEKINKKKLKEQDEDLNKKVIFHTQFGKGLLLNVDKTRLATIKFETVGIKQLNLAVAIKNDQIKMD